MEDVNNIDTKKIIKKPLTSMFIEISGNFVENTGFEPVASTLPA